MAGWDDPLERSVFVGMIFDVYGEALFGRIEARPLGNGPGLQDSIALQPQIVVQSSSRVLLDHEKKRAAARLEGLGGRLGRGGEGTLCGVLAQRRGFLRGGRFRALALRRSVDQDDLSGGAGWRLPEESKERSCKC